MVDASTQTNDYDSEPDDVVQDEDDGKSNGAFSAGQYMVAIAASKIYLQTSSVEP